jgi:hypothetical protein
MPTGVKWVDINDLWHYDWGRADGNRQPKGNWQ